MTVKERREVRDYLEMTRNALSSIVTLVRVSINNLERIQARLQEELSDGSTIHTPED